MRKTLTAAQIKRLPVGTDIFYVDNETGESGKFCIVKNGRKKLLKGLLSDYEIVDKVGWHYEVEE